MGEKTQKSTMLDFFQEQAFGVFNVESNQLNAAIIYSANYCFGSLAPLTFPVSAQYSQIKTLSHKGAMIL